MSSVSIPSVQPAQPSTPTSAPSQTQAIRSSMQQTNRGMEDTIKVLQIQVMMKDREIEEKEDKRRALEGEVSRLRLKEREALSIVIPPMPALPPITSPSQLTGHLNKHLEVREMIKSVSLPALQQQSLPSHTVYISICIHK